MGSLKNKNKFGIIATSCVFSCSLFLTANVMAEQQYASKERATIARAHVSRARALLVEALAEFEESKKYARPDMLIDSEDWRLRVISLTEQLNRVVDPRPRVTREGAVFRTPPRFIRREKEQLPEVLDGAKSRNDIGERDRLNKKQQERARFFNEPADATRAAAAKNQDLAKLPNGLQLPDEPELDTPSSGSKKGNPTKEEAINPGNTDKSLFSNDLMPELNGAAKKQDQEKLIAPSEIIKREKEQNFKDQNNLIEGEVLKDAQTKSILPPLEGRAEEEIEDANGNQLLPPADKSKSNAIQGQSSKFDKIGPDSVPEIVSDEEAVGEIPAEAAKQESEDDALARRLEESISEKLTNRDADRN